MSIVSERLHTLREENGLSQKQMGERIDLSRTSYKNYENAQSYPPISVFINIAIKFDISIDYLTGRIDEKQKISKTYDLKSITPFSVRVKELRKQQGMTQEFVSKEIGLVHKSPYICYERAEKEPSLPRLIALADLFDVSLDYLVGFNEK